MSTRFILFTSGLGLPNVHLKASGLKYYFQEKKNICSLSGGYCLFRLFSVWKRCLEQFSFNKTSFSHPKYPDLKSYSLNILSDVGNGPGWEPRCLSDWGDSTLSITCGHHLTSICEHSAGHIYARRLHTFILLHRWRNIFCFDIIIYFLLTFLINQRFSTALDLVSDLEDRGVSWEA